ncbi:hypothetical protein HDZ31DRAFT_59918 [Schizophyllum fasciatum]
MERQKTRKRDAECPIVTYRVGQRTFERLLKEDSLEDTKTAIRQKLRVEDGVYIQLAQLRDGMTIDLEDEDDFDAFHTAAHKASGATVRVTVVQTNGVPAPQLSIAPSESISTGVGASTRSVRFSSPEDEHPQIGGKRKASALESASGDEGASAPPRGRAPKRRKDDGAEHAHANATENEEAAAPVVVAKKKRGRPRIHPLPEDVEVSGPSAHAEASASRAEPPPHSQDLQLVAPELRSDTPEPHAAAPEPIATVPEKKKRGRPRIHPLPESAPSAPAPVEPAAGQPSAFGQSASAAQTGETPLVPVKRKPGRPRKHPLPESAATVNGKHAAIDGSNASAANKVTEAPQPAAPSRGRTGGQRPVDNVEFAQELAQVIASRRTRSRSRSRAADERTAAGSKLRVALAGAGQAAEAPALDAPANDEPDAHAPSEAEAPKRGRKKKAVPSGEEADNEDATPEGDVAPKERKKRKKAVREEGADVREGDGAVDLPEQEQLHAGRPRVVGTEMGEEVAGEALSVKKKRKKRKKKPDVAGDVSEYRTNNDAEHDADRTGEMSEAEIDEGRMAARARFLAMLEQHQALKTTEGKLWSKEREKKKRLRKGAMVAEKAQVAGEAEVQEARDKAEEQGKRAEVAEEKEVRDRQTEQEDDSAPPAKRKSRTKKPPSTPRNEGSDTLVHSGPSAITQVAGATTPPESGSIEGKLASLAGDIEPTDLEAIIQGPSGAFTVADIPSDDEDEEPQRMDLDPEDEDEDERRERRRRKKRASTRYGGSISSDEERASALDMDDIEEDGEETTIARDTPADAEMAAIEDEAHPEAADQEQHRPPSVQRRASGQHHSFASIDRAASSPEVDRSADIAYNRAFGDEHPSDFEGLEDAAVAASDGHETDTGAQVLGYPSDPMSDADQLPDPQGGAADAQPGGAGRGAHDGHADAMDEDPIEAPPPTQSAPPSPIESILPDLHSPFQSTPRERVADRMKGRNGRVRGLMPSPVAEAILATSGSARGMRATPSPAMKALLMPPWTQPERETRQSSRLSTRRPAGSIDHTPDASYKTSMPTPSGVPPARRADLTSSSQPVNDTQPSLTQWTTLPNVPPSPSTLPPEDSMAEGDQLRSSPEAQTLSPQLRRKSGQARPPLFFPADSQSNYPFSQYNPPQLPSDPDQEEQRSQAGDDLSGGEEDANTPSEAGAEAPSDEDDSEREIRESMQSFSRAPSQTQAQLSQYRTLSDIARASPFSLAPKRAEFPKDVETSASRKDSLYGQLAQDSDSSDGGDDGGSGDSRQAPSHIPKERQAGRKPTENGGPT